MRSEPKVRARQRSLLTAGRAGCRALLDLIYPETCALCGAEPGERDWTAAGPLVAGLAWYDGTNLCRACADRLAPAVVRGLLPESDLPVFAGRRTGPELVALLGQWKYHGVRGLAWPLAPLVQAAVGAAVASSGPVDRLVPISLHRRRRRMRGFNQAAVLARLAAGDHGLIVDSGLLRRVRSTGQQAKLATDAARRDNVAGAFEAVSGPTTDRGGRIGLVDDLVTGGTTCEAAAKTLTAAGWQVSWVVCLGLATAINASPLAGPGQSEGRVDTAPLEI